MKITSIDLSKFLNDYCIDLLFEDHANLITELNIDINTSVCARCLIPFNETTRKPSKLGLIDEYEEVYIIFCKHCDRYLRNDDGSSDYYVYGEES